MLISAKFENFRCFNKLNIDKLGQLTIISGKNNSGKSSILEGIYIFSSFQRPDFLFNIHAIRGMDLHLTQTLNGNIVSGLDSYKLWQTLFYNTKSDIPISISFQTADNINKEITIIEDDISSLSELPPFIPERPFIENKVLKINYIENTNEVFTTYYIVNGSSVISKIVKKQNKLSLPLAIYFGSNAHITQKTLAEWLGIIERKNCKNRIVEALKNLISDVDDLFVVNNKIDVDIYCRLKNEQSYPIRIMGDGINLLLNYISAIVANPNSIFLIDEIENGFHYSFYPTLWHILADTAIENNSQIIFTSHSRECVQAASYIMKSAFDNMDLLTYIRLDNNCGEIYPTIYDTENLSFALENDMEIR